VVKRHLEDLKSYHVSDADRSRLEKLIQNRNITQRSATFSWTIALLTTIAEKLPAASTSTNLQQTSGYQSYLPVSYLLLLLCYCLAVFSLVYVAMAHRLLSTAK
jgi:hypothetical protein